MLKKLRRKVESNRKSTNPLWKFAVLLKDVLWKIISFVREINSSSSKIQRAIKSSNGILHIGAHKGQEAEKYALLGKSVVWIEAIPQIYKKLVKNISKYKNQIAINALVADKDYKEYMFKISNNDGMSSSIFDFGEYSSGKKSLWPQLKLKMVDRIKLKSKTLKSIYKEYLLEKKKLDFLVLDVQGAELNVLIGAGDIIDNFNYIFCEISKVEVYKKATSWRELRKFLNKKGFYEIDSNPGLHQDVLFVRLNWGNK